MGNEKFGCQVFNVILSLFIQIMCEKGFCYLEVEWWSVLQRLVKILFYLLLGGE